MLHDAWSVDGRPDEVVCHKNTWATMVKTQAALVAALEAMCAEYELRFVTGALRAPCSTELAYDQARAAIALARGEK